MVTESPADTIRRAAPKIPASGTVVTGRLPLPEVHQRPSTNADNPDPDVAYVTGIIEHIARLDH